VDFEKEGLALSQAEPGEYILEIVRAFEGAERANPGAGVPPAVRGELVVSAVGARKVIPFYLTGNRLVLGIARISLVAKLVPVSDFDAFESGTLRAR